MKFSRLILLACISVCMTFVSCKDSAEESKSDTPASVSPNANPATNPGVMDPTNQAAQTPAAQPASPGTQQQINIPTTAAVGGESHYKCPTAGCTGGGDAKGACSVCGAELAHNQAYHAQNQGAQTPVPSQTTPIMIDPASGKPATPEQLSPPAAQNASGEYHYACPAGHAGAGSAGSCSTCGAELAHNTAYHNK